MKRARTTIVAAALIALAAGARTMFAGSVLLRQSLGTNGAGGAVVNLEVRNVTGVTIQNVDVRLLQPQVDSLPKGVVQFGTLTAQQARTVSAAIILSADRSQPFVWQVDFDDAAGHHSQSVVPNQ